MNNENSPNSEIDYDYGIELETELERVNIMNKHSHNVIKEYKEENQLVKKTNLELQFINYKLLKENDQLKEIKHDLGIQMPIFNSMQKKNAKTTIKYCENCHYEIKQD